MPISISVVLPAFNEAANIEATVTSVVSYMQSRHLNYEIIVVNDGSKDSTGEILQLLGDRHCQLYIINHAQNLGYGSALRSGFDHAGKDYIFLMDSDRQFNINDLDQFLDQFLGQLTSEPQILIGYRQQRADGWVRSLNAWAYHQLIRLLFGLKVQDIDCAFKLFPRSSYMAITPIQANGALFSAEMLIKWQNLGLKYRQIPVRHYPRQYGKQTGANVGVILKMFWECWQLKKQLNPIKSAETIRSKPHPLIKPLH